MRTLVDIPDKQPNELVEIGKQEKRLILITRNAKDFTENESGIRVPYKLNK
jgi:hypothetical protein